MQQVGPTRVAAESQAGGAALFEGGRSTIRSALRYIGSAAALRVDADCRSSTGSNQMRTRSRCAFAVKELLPRGFSSTLLPLTPGASWSRTARSGCCAGLSNPMVRVLQIPLADALLVLLRDAAVRFHANPLPRDGGNPNLLPTFSESENLSLHTLCFPKTRLE